MDRILSTTNQMSEVRIYGISKPYEPDCIKLSEASEEYLNYMRK